MSRPLEVLDGGTPASRFAGISDFPGGGLSRPEGGKYSAGWAAQEFAARFAGEARFSRDAGSWFVYDGGRWIKDQSSVRVERLVIRFYDECLRHGADTHDRDLARWAVLDRSHQIGDVLRLARSDPRVVVGYGDFDDPDRCEYLLNVENGTLDLRTGELRSHDPSDLITRIAPVAFDPGAPCPRFDRFLSEIFQEDAELMAFFWRAIGYCLTGSMKEQVFFVLYGEGANGKSTLLSVLLALLGDYGASPNISTFTATRWERSGADASPNLAALRGVRLAAAVEPRVGASLDESKIKQITGGDPIRARYLYEGEFQFKPECKLFFAVNSPPRIKDPSEGMWRRVRLVPFKARFEGVRRDPDLARTLKDELPGILAKAVRACDEWQGAGGLGAPKGVEAATRAFRRDEDAMARFIEECTEPAVGERVKYRVLRSSYEKWCDREGEGTLGLKAFGQALERNGIPKANQGGVAYREGIRIRRAEGEREVRPGGDDDQFDSNGISADAYQEREK